MPQLDNYKQKMQDNLKRLAQGVVEYEKPELVIEPANLELEIYSGETCEGVIELSVQGNKSISGHIVSANPRMKVKISEFSGNTDTIRYSFDASGFEAGDVLKGELVLISDAGEHTIPYTVVIPHAQAVSNQASEAAEEESETEEAEEVKQYSIKRSDDEFIKKIKDQKYHASLLKTYIEFRINNIGIDAWADKSEANIDYLIKNNGEKAEYLLFRAHIKALTGQENAVREILLSLKDEIKKESPLVQGYYLYVSYLMEEDRAAGRELARQLQSLYTENREQDLLLWMLLYVDEDVAVSPSSQLFMMQRQHDNNGLSPLLYLEACSLYLKDSTLLAALGAFELQVINFAVKTSLLDNEFADRICTLISKEKEITPVMLKILKGIYDDTGLLSAVSAICSYYISRECFDEDAFEWYSTAVNRNLNITKLYESFIYALPSDYMKELPREVQIYFSYGATLPESRRSVLYANIIKYHDSYPEILLEYNSQMLDFAVEMAQRCEIDASLAVLYDYMKHEERFKDIFDRRLDTFVFSHSVSVLDPEAKAIVVKESAFSEPKRILLKDKKACPVIYGKEYTVTAQREDMSEIENCLIYDIPLFNPEEYISRLSAFGTNNAGLCLYLSENNRRCRLVDEENYDYVMALLLSPKVSKRCKSEYRPLILDYLIEKEEYPKLQAIVEQLDIDSLGRKERGQIVRLYVKQNRYRDARNILSFHGIQNVEDFILHQFITIIPESELMEFDSFIYSICVRLFNAGMRDDLIIKYLLREAEGTSRFLREVWRAAREKHANTRQLEEKMLIQMLYTGVYIAGREEIFEAYKENSALEMLELAWNTNNAYEYLLKQAVMEEDFFDKLLAAGLQDDNLNDVCKLALIHYYAEDEDQSADVYMGDEVKEFIRNSIEEFLQRKIILKCFMHYADFVPALDLYKSLFFVEHIARPDAIVNIHYKIGAADSDEDKYITETMRPVVPGIFSKKLVLFYDERIEYYITEENNGDVETMQREVNDGESMVECGLDNRFGIINEMLDYRQRGEYDKMIKCMDVYYRREHMSSKLFDTLVHVK